MRNRGDPWDEGTAPKSAASKSAAPGSAIPGSPVPAGGFSRLHPLIREYIYEKKWKRLRTIQEAAIGAVLDGDSHILIASGTASGKTEAAFFPIITLLLARAEASVAVLYIGPLKALINDQFQRLEELLSRARIPLRRWHGDVPGTRKNELLENPSGIVQITPESLEALLLRRPEKIRSLFSNLSFIIIDEVHSFMGSDRGSQLLCQIGRIEEEAGCLPRRIGLSATLGDYGAALRWLGLGSAGKTLLIQEGETKKRFSLAVDCFGADPVPAASPGEAPAAYYGELYRQCRNRRCIIFTNSRLEAEETVARLREEAGRRREADVFYVHHGSVSRVLRMEAEQELREQEGPLVTAATATLEMGIDIGNLDRIIQIGPPYGVASFLQRLGRSGRRRENPEMYFTSLEEGGRGINAIPWTLLRTVAVIQLYLEEKWIEDAPRRPLPYSLLCHQTLSVLASLGEQGFPDLTRRVLSLPPFEQIPPEDFRELLFHLIEGEYIQKTEEGTLIIGLEGERIVTHFSFYAVFPEEESYRVLFGGKELGTLHFLPPIGSGLVLAGHYWRVETVDRNHREILVCPGESGGERVWRGGSAELHGRILERMKMVLTENREYPYLSRRALRRLGEARRYFQETPLTGEPFLPQGEGFFCIPWLGSGGMRTLAALFQNREVRKILELSSFYRKNEYAFYMASRLSLPAFKAALGRLPPRLDKPLDLMEEDKIPLTDKYDYLLPRRLRLKQYAANMLDGEAARRFLEDAAGQRG
jgi:ATP-dependent Lhr-like helicase